MSCSVTRASLECCRKFSMTHVECFARSAQQAVLLRVCIRNEENHKTLESLSILVVLLCPTTLRHDAMLRPSVCLSIVKSVCPDFVTFDRWQYMWMCITASGAFDRGQHNKLCPHPNTINGGYRFIVQYFVCCRNINRT